MKDIYKDLPTQYKRIFKISDKFSSYHFLLTSKLLNGDMLTEQINQFKKSAKKKKPTDFLEISNNQFEDKDKKNEVQQFLSVMIDFTRELELKFSRSFIKYYFKNLYFIKDSKKLEESIQRSTKDVELDYMMIKKIEEEERQKMIYYDGEYIPSKKIDKKIDFYLLREIRNFLSIKFDVTKKCLIKNGKPIEFENLNLLKLVISYYRDSIAYPMFQMIYNLILTNIIEDNLKNTFSILYSFMKTLLHFIELLRNIFSKIKNNESCNDILDNLLNFEKLEAFLTNNVKEDESKNNLLIYINAKKDFDASKNDTYTQLFEYLENDKNDKSTIFHENTKVEVTPEPQLYIWLLDELAKQISDELEEKFTISKISMIVTKKEKDEKDRQKKILYNDAETVENQRKEDVYKLDNIFEKLFTFIYLFDFGFNKYDVDNDQKSEVETVEEPEIFSLKNSFKTVSDYKNDQDSKDSNDLDEFFKNFVGKDEKEKIEKKLKPDEKEFITSQNNLMNDNRFKKSLFTFNINQDLEESEKPSFYNNLDIILEIYHDSPNLMQASIIKYLPQEKELNFFTFNYNNEITNNSYLIYLDLINFDSKEIDDTYKNYFVKIVEFYRLLCEDHNANIQSILTDPNQNEIMFEYKKKLKEVKKEEKKVKRLKNQLIDLKKINKDKNENSEEDSDEDSDGEEKLELDEDGNKIVQNMNFLKFKFLNKKEHEEKYNDCEIKIKNPHIVGNNIVEVLVNLWININETGK